MPLLTGAGGVIYGQKGFRQSARGRKLGAAKMGAGKLSKAFNELYGSHRLAAAGEDYRGILGAGSNEEP